MCAMKLSVRLWTQQWFRLPSSPPPSPIHPSTLACKRSSLPLGPVVNRDVESAAQETFEATPADKRTMPTAPTLDEMLTSGSSANALLAATFIDQAQPLVIRPVSTGTVPWTVVAGVACSCKGTTYM